MKKTFLFLVLFLIFSCSAVYKVNDNIQDYNENIVYQINKVQEDYSIATGSNSYIYPSRGNKFVHVYLTITNKTNVVQPLDFNNFYLINPDTKTKYLVEFVYLSTIINIAAKIESSIQPNDTKYRRLIYIFPKDVKPKFLMVNDKIVEISYQN